MRLFRLASFTRATVTALLTTGALLVGCTGSDRTTPARPQPAAVDVPLADRTPPPAKMVDAHDAGTHPPAEPAYDLEADRARRIAMAKEELGARASTSVVADVFVLIGPPGGARYDASVALVRSSMAGFLNGRFGKKPSQAISVFLFPDAAGYESFCTRKYAAPCIAHYGFYQPGDRYMVMNIGLGLGTLTHELVHPLVEADFPEAPTWLNEGIASVFEQPVIPRPGEIHGAKNWRHPRLKRALSSPSEKEKARLDRFFGMRDETFRGVDEDLHYAAARYVCQWLDERGKLWAFYQRWRDTVGADPTGEHAFQEVVGMSPAEAHAPWSKWALAL